MNGSNRHTIESTQVEKIVGWIKNRGGIAIVDVLRGQK